MDDGEQFCTKNKEYYVIYQNGNEFKIISDLNVHHYFDVYNCDYFKLIYEDDNL